MAKTSVKTVFHCSNCGNASAKWVGKCSSCNEWNTFVEEVIDKKGKAASTPAWVSSENSKKKAIPVNINEIEGRDDQRTKAPGHELNRVLGGGIVAGSLVLIGGEPGIGKSTLMLQAALRLNKRVLYVSGEESENQLKMRADRIGIKNDDCYILSATKIEDIFTQIKNLKPDLVVVDSIQTLYSQVLDSTPGSVSQIRECAGQMLRYCKESGVPVFLIGHITKDGNIAGPKVLEHMVDTVLQFEGDRHHTYRILRAVKNRFGSASELGIYEMQGTGLREVSNPSEILISQRDEPISGISIVATMEGVRPLMIETQALVSSAVYGTPQRNSNGYDIKRLNMLLAVLEKRCGFQLGSQDVFINIAGGLRLEDPGADLGVAVAILSSYENEAIPTDVVLLGEIGLSGEIRAVNRVDQRIAEAEKLGFTHAIVSKYNEKGLASSKMKVSTVAKIEDVVQMLFSND
jgi:DNA repair protein RadA/Sms